MAKGRKEGDDVKKDLDWYGCMADTHAANYQREAEEDRDKARRERDEAVALLRDWVRDSLDSGGNTSVAAMNFLRRIDKKEKP